MTDPGMREAPLTFESPLGEGSDERRHDTLDLLPYAQALGEFIQQCETPISIGIQGAWGVGKTTLMNMLRGSGEVEGSGLLDGEWCKAIDFETWSYAQFNHDNDLAIACIHALTTKLGGAIEPDDQIEGLEVRSSVYDAQERLEAVLRHIHTPIPTGPFKLRGSDGSRDIPPHHDVAALMLAFRREFEKLVNYWVGDDERRRIVIFIDDLDRVRPVEAVILLEAIRNFIDVRGCVFVLAVDREVVQQGVAEHLGAELQKVGGKAFYDKLIQVPFVLPAPGDQLEGYIIDLLSGVDFPFSEELGSDQGSSEFFVGITLATVGRSPRNIKRVINSAGLQEKVRRHGGGGESDARDAGILYAIACMQIAWPELFEHFIADPTVETVSGLQNLEYLEALPGARQLFERHPDREKLQSDISTFFGTLFRLLDETDDGEVDSAKLDPLLEVMAVARLA